MKKNPQDLDGLYKNFKKVPFNVEKKLRKIYFNVGKEGAFASLSYLKKTFPKYKKHWESFLQTLNAYNVTLSHRKTF